MMGKSQSKERKKKILRPLPSKKDLLYSQGNTVVQNTYEGDEHSTNDATQDEECSANGGATTQMESAMANGAIQVGGPDNIEDIQISLEEEDETENIYSEPDFPDGTNMTCDDTLLVSPFTDRMLPSLPAELQYNDNKRNSDVGYEVPQHSMNREISETSSTYSTGSRSTQQQNPLQTLLTYGFDRRRAQEALTLCDDDLVQAIAYLHNTRELNPRTIALRKIQRPSLSEIPINEERSIIPNVNHNKQYGEIVRGADLSPEENFELLKLADEYSDAIPNTEPFECPLCGRSIAMGDGMVLRECLHTFCRSCVEQAIKDTTKPFVQCPYIVPEDGTRCQLLLQDREIHAVIGDTDFKEHIKQRLITFEKETNKGYHCKSANCCGFYIIEGDPIKQFNCSICGCTNCMLCQTIHSNQSMCPVK